MWLRTPEDEPFDPVGVAGSERDGCVAEHREHVEALERQSIGEGQDVFDIGFVTDLGDVAGERPIPRLS
jgi:hypothetical protein